jgi:hypothetical protein
VDTPYPKFHDKQTKKRYLHSSLIRSSAVIGIEEEADDFPEKVAC